jgi:hypothetical protein
LFPHREGWEGICCKSFEDIGRMTDKAVGYMLGKKNYEINHLSTPQWKKLIWQIHAIQKNYLKKAELNANLEMENQVV